MRKNTAIVFREGYTPNHLLDTLMAKLGVKSDAALARALSMPPSTISKVRNRLMPVNSSLLLAAHEVTELSIRELRTLLGDTETRYWLGDQDLGDERAMFSSVARVSRPAADSMHAAA